jgi:hypothetical protein
MPNTPSQLGAQAASAGTPAYGYFSPSTPLINDPGASLNYITPSTPLENYTPPAASGTAIAVLRPTGGALTGGELQAGCVYRFVFDGTCWRLSAYVPAVINVPFNAANFTASSPGTFTVASGGQLSYWYVKIGNLMLVSWTVSGTVSGSPQWLQIAVPGGFTIANDNLAAIWTSSPNGGNIGYADATIGTTQIMTSYAAQASTWASGMCYTQGQLFLQTTT